VEFEQLTHQNIDSFCERLAAFLGTHRFTIANLGGHVYKDVFLEELPYVKDVDYGCKAVYIATHGGMFFSLMSCYQTPNTAPIVDKWANKVEFAFVGHQLIVLVDYFPSGQTSAILLFTS